MARCSLHFFLHGYGEAMPLIINNEPIPDELLHEEFQIIKAHYESMGSVSCCERDPEFRGSARENVVARVLLNQEAERRFPEVGDAEVQAALGRLLEEHGGAEAFCQKLGIDSAEDPRVLGDIVSGLRLDKLLFAAWGPLDDPAETELRAFYEEHLSDYLTDERVRALHIFKQVEKVEDREKIYEELRDVRRRVRSGEDFETMAIAHTDKEDKLVDLGYFRRGEFMDEFDLIAFSLEEGEISPVFASHWGFHLAKITGREPKVPKPFESVREAVKERFLADQKQRKTRELVDQLRAAADIQDLRRPDGEGEPAHGH